MIYPQFIKKDEYIGVPAPSAGAGVIEKENKMLNAKKNLKNLGYNLKLSKNLLNSVKGRSASGEERAKEVNEMFEDKEIKTILCASGGDFLVEMLSHVNFELLKNNPKWVCRIFRSNRTYISYNNEIRYCYNIWEKF